MVKGQDRYRKNKEKIKKKKHGKIGDISQKKTKIPKIDSIKHKEYLDEPYIPFFSVKTS